MDVLEQLVWCNCKCVFCSRPGSWTVALEKDCLVFNLDSSCWWQGGGKKLHIWIPFYLFFSMKIFGAVWFLCRQVDGNHVEGNVQAWKSHPISTTYGLHKACGHTAPLDRTKFTIITHQLLLVSSLPWKLKLLIMEPLGVCTLVFSDTGEVYPSFGNMIP